jgi:hypothetical protein
MKLPLTQKTGEILSKLQELKAQIAITQELLLQLQNEILINECNQDFINKRFLETK